MPITEPSPERTCSDIASAQALHMNVQHELHSPQATSDQTRPPDGRPQARSRQAARIGPVKNSNETLHSCTKHSRTQQQGLPAQRTRRTAGSAGRVSRRARCRQAAHPRSEISGRARRRQAADPRPERSVSSRSADSSSRRNCRPVCCSRSWVSWGRGLASVQRA